MSKLKPNNQLVKESASSTTVSINSDDGKDVEIPPPFLQSNSIIPDDFLNISGSLSQTITAIPSLNQSNVAQYESSDIEPFSEPVNVGQRSLPHLGTLPLDNLRSPDLFNVVNSNTIIGTTLERQKLINEIQKSFVESLHADIEEERENHMKERRKEEQTKISGDAIRLMNEYKNRVLPVPNMDGEVTFLSVRHPDLETIRSAIQ